MPRCLLALGTNLGDRENTLRVALCKLAALPQTRLLSRSSWHETPAVGGPEGQQSFLNGAVLLDSLLEPQELADTLQAIEAQQGRERKVRWAARTLDIDLLVYGSVTLDTPTLTIPHPRMSFRSFVLEPAAEIAGHLVVPHTGWTIASLLNHLRSAARYVAIAGTDPFVADWLASQLCQRLKSPRLEDFFLMARGEDDSQLLSAVEWQQHQVLHERLSPSAHETRTTIAPVISGFWHPVKNLIQVTGTVRPGLVIAVDPPTPVLLNLPRGNQAVENKAGIESREFHKLLCRPNLGPLARITAATPEVVLDEALAAISAAWPD